MVSTRGANIEQLSTIALPFYLENTFYFFVLYKIGEIIHGNEPLTESHLKANQLTTSDTQL